MGVNGCADFLLLHILYANQLAIPILKTVVARRTVFRLLSTDGGVCVDGEFSPTIPEINARIKNSFFFIFEPIFQVNTAVVVSISLYEYKNKSNLNSD